MKSALSSSEGRGAGKHASGGRKRLAIVSSHPIQYHGPWFQRLALRPELDLHVFYGRRATPQQQGAAGFGVGFDWDVPLLEGYRHTFLDGNARSFAAHATDFDAVLVNGWHEPLLRQAVRDCWKQSVPVMVRGDSHLHEPRPRWKRLAKDLPYRWASQRMSACLAVGTWSREYFLHYGVPPERIFVVPHTVADAWFAARVPELESRRRELRLKWSLAEQSTVLLFAGKFTPVKRPLDLLHALREAAAPNLELLMVGDGPLRAQCERLVATHRLPVRFAGFLNQSQMVNAYVAADLLVLPSASESWGIAVNEAAACSRPALVSDRVGCGPDLIRPGVTGDIFPMGNVSALADLVRRYAGNTAKLRQMGLEAKQAVTRFSRDPAIEGVIEAVNAIARQDVRR